ncbi:hypothetical protein [Paraflavitalea speifideaquila]|uniref:hypothetical protein n=1 Tax=Paraflavitalea speifideaquila TaxID=3076558 RepID=UPI0028EE3B84|nr:hypothetical protein [Paraflavitalea speifideiaquila]
MTYNFYKTFAVSGNLNYNDIKGNSTPDLFVTGFNTPRWTANLSFGNRAITKDIGFNITWRWQDAFLWESPLVTGRVAAYQTVDAQVTFRVPKVHSTIKAGGTDLLNHRYLQYAGGPSLGGLYYVAITIDGLLK